MTRTHVALLRGINVGGHGRLPMADLRRLVEGLGWGEVATYVQSGNVAMAVPDAEAADGTDALADRLEAALAARTQVHPAVVVLTRAELDRVVADNPYPDEQDPTHLHVTVDRDRVGGADRAALVAAALERARAKGSPDAATVVGPHVYLRTPQGLGRSVLAAELARGSRGRATGTTRNWRTVTALARLLAEPAG
ncbi:DUF1697 domain-containing protein [Cellulomonas endophytica]|uniref:DUF1697 domain-containing protein n=1 Tax=Cellulomonas endophytica TaxID=2494735 RepID=UPI0010112CB1|nr:DUF1697 domain-containing protein [Cellulomonas endophytica]